MGIVVYVQVYVCEHAHLLAYMHVYGGYKTTSHAVLWELSTPSETKILADLELTKASKAAQRLKSSTAPGSALWKEPLGPLSHGTASVYGWLKACDEGGLRPETKLGKEWSRQCRPLLFLARCWGAKPKHPHEK